MAITTGIFSVGCFSNKNKDVADNAAPPPPAAYPDSSGSYANTATVAGSAAPSIPAAPTVGSDQAATAGSPASAPAPFALREGEQLVPHNIVSGDSLSSIAGKYNTSIGRIQAANGMTDTRIYAGKMLQVPTMMASSPLAMNATAPAPGGGSPENTARSYPGTPPPTGGAYPSTTPVPPSAPAGTIGTPPAPYPAGGIAAPPVPSAPNIAGSASIEVPANPAATSYPREGAIPAPPQPGGSYPVPSFEGSRIQFGQ